MRCPREVQNLAMDKAVMLELSYGQGSNVRT